MERSRIDFDDLQAFFLVAETGSFARAAERLDSSKSIISRRVARLEATLSALLLQRTARGTRLTEAGQIYYDQAHNAMTQLEVAAESVSEIVTDISGAIRITGPVYFGAEYLVPVLTEFATHYPNIELLVDLIDEKVDLISEGYDIAVRVGHLPDSNLTARQLCQSKRVLVASPDYLARMPPIRTPKDLSEHHIVHYNGLVMQDLWRYHVKGETLTIPIRPRLRSNNAYMLMSWVKAGLGLTVLPVYITGVALQSGDVEMVLSDHDWGLTPVSMVLPQGRNTTRRVRTLTEFLVLKFQNRFA